MPIYKSNQPIEVIRKTNTKGLEIMVGDQIHVSKYTATCQKITQAGALFLLDQYLDQAYPMNAEDSNRGGYEASDLRKTLQSEEVLKIFAEYRDRMQPFDNGDLLRIPFFGEIFGKEDANYFEPDGCEQWPLMKDRKNRIAFRDNSWEWGWLQNKRKGSAPTSATSATVALPTAWAPRTPSASARLSLSFDHTIPGPSRPRTSGNKPARRNRWIRKLSISLSTKEWGT